MRKEMIRLSNNNIPEVRALLYVIVTLWGERYYCCCRRLFGCLCWYLNDNETRNLHKFLTNFCFHALPFSVLWVIDFPLLMSANVVTAKFNPRRTSLGMSWEHFHVCVATATTIINFNFNCLLALSYTFFFFDKTFPESRNMSISL